MKVLKIVFTMALFLLIFAGCSAKTSPIQDPPVSAKPDCKALYRDALTDVVAEAKSAREEGKSRGRFAIEIVDNCTIIYLLEDRADASDPVDVKVHDWHYMTGFNPFHHELFSLNVKVIVKENYIIYAEYDATE